MEIDKKLDFLSKLRLKQTYLTNDLSDEEVAIFKEIVEDLKVLESIKMNSKVPDVTATPEGVTMIVESTLYKTYTKPLSDGSYVVGVNNAEEFDRVLNYFMKFYKEKLNV